jgi:hypothetical protein
MTRYRGKKSSRPGVGFTRPNLKHKKRRSPDGSNQPKSPLLQHFFFWVVVLSMFMGIFGGFQTAIQSVVLWNDFYTLFGVVSYWDATISWVITIIVAMCVDLLLVAE